MSTRGRKQKEDPEHVPVAPMEERLLSVSQEQSDRVKQLYLAKVPAQEIAAATGMGKTVVNRLLKALETELSMSKVAFAGGEKANEFMQNAVIDLIRRSQNRYQVHDDEVTKKNDTREHLRGMLDEDKFQFAVMTKAGWWDVLTPKKSIIDAEVVQQSSAMDDFIAALGANRSEDLTGISDRTLQRAMREDNDEDEFED